MSPGREPPALTQTSALRGLLCGDVTGFGYIHVRHLYCSGLITVVQGHSVSRMQFLPWNRPCLGGVFIIIIIQTHLGTRQFNSFLANTLLEPGWLDGGSCGPSPSAGVPSASVPGIRSSAWGSRGSFFPGGCLHARMRGGEKMETLCVPKACILYLYAKARI